MTSWEEFFSSGKFVECSDLLSGLLRANENDSDGSADRLKETNLSYYFRHNKIICDALSYNWLDGESQQLHECWSTTFQQLDNLCRTLKCQLSVSNVPHTLYLATVLNLLWWSWESLDPIEAYMSRVDQWIADSLQTELSACGESVLEAENVLELAEVYCSCLVRIPPQNCNLILDILILYLLLLPHRKKEDGVFERCFQIMTALLDNLPQIYIHLSSGDISRNGDLPSLCLLGPNVAALNSDADLTISLVALANVIYSVTVKHYDKGWQILQDNSCTKSTKVQCIAEYLKAFVSLKRHDLERALYYLERLSAVPLEAVMIKRKNILNGWIYYLKKDFKTALKYICGNSDVSEDEDQLPIAVFLMAQSHGGLGHRKKQMIVLELLADALRGDPGYLANRLSPSASLENRLLKCIHNQPELTLLQTLLAAAEASIEASCAEDSSKFLLEALKVLKLSPGSQEEQDDIIEVPPLQDVLRNAATALVMCEDFRKARILCNSLMDFHLEEKESNLNQAITRILLVHAETEYPVPKKQMILHDAVRLLLKQRALSVKNESAASDLILADLLLARTYYLKAKLYADCAFNNDADAYFQRATASNPEDAAVICQYKSFLKLVRAEGESVEPLALQKNEDISSHLNVTLCYLLKIKKAP